MSKFKAPWTFLVKKNQSYNELIAERLGKRLYKYQSYQYQIGLEELTFVGCLALYLDGNCRCSPNICPNMIRGKTYRLQVLGFEPATSRALSLRLHFPYLSLARELHNGTTILDRRETRKLRSEIIQGDSTIMARWKSFSMALKHPQSMRKWTTEHAHPWRNSIVMVRLANFSQKSRKSTRTSPCGYRAIKGHMHI